MDSFDSTKKSLYEILKDVHSGKIQLPDFQRNCVCDDNNRITPKYKSQIFGFLLLFFNITAIAQVPSQKEFISDFDSLVAIIRELDPRLQSWKDLAGIDIRKEIEKQRKYVDTITSTNDFMALINATLHKCLDGHASVVPPAVFQYMLEQLPAPEQQHLSIVIISSKILRSGI